MTTPVLSRAATASLTSTFDGESISRPRKPHFFASSNFSSTDPLCWIIEYLTAFLSQGPFVAASAAKAAGFALKPTPAATPTVAVDFKNARRVTWRIVPPGGSVSGCVTQMAATTDIAERSSSLSREIEAPSSPRTLDGLLSERGGQRV